MKDQHCMLTPSLRFIFASVVTCVSVSECAGKLHGKNGKNVKVCEMVSECLTGMSIGYSL